MDISFEFFPPSSLEGRDKLIQAAKQLSAFNPTFFSVTFGADGSEQANTFETVKMLSSYTNVPVAPHISCVAATKESINALLQKYEALGVARLVVLRGDLPTGKPLPSDFQYATELVRYIRETTGDQFHIQVACYPEYHPQSIDATSDFQYFAQKINAGANGAITQYFYHPDAYFHFVERCERIGIQCPIIPGIMPILNHRKLAYFSDHCGADLPRFIRKELESLEHDKVAQFEFGIETLTHLCEALLQGGAPGLHFYTLNQPKASIRICQNLNITQNYVTPNLHRPNH